MQLDLFLLNLLAIPASLVLFRRAAGSLSVSRLNMISWIFYSAVLIPCFVSTALISSGMTGHYIITTFDESTIRYASGMIIYATIGLPLGMLLYGAIFETRRPKRIFANFCDQPVSRYLRGALNIERAFVMVISLIGCAGVIYTYSGVEHAGMMQAFADPESAAVTRQSLTRGFDGNVYIKNIIALTLTPWMSYVAYAFWRTTRRYVDLALSLVTFIFSLAAVTYSGAKAPVILYLLGFLFTLVLLNGRVRIKHLVTAFVAAITFLLIFYSSVMGVSLSSMTLLDGIPGRVLFTQIAGVYKSVEYFPAEPSHLSFKSMSQIVSNALDFEYTQRSARLIMERFRPTAVDNGTAGVMNSLFVGEAWANFGLYGVILSPIYVGFMVQALYSNMLKLKKTPLAVGTLAYLSYKIPVLGGFNDFIYNPTIIFVIVVMLAVKFGAQLSGKRRFHEHDLSSSTPARIGYRSG